MASNKFTQFSALVVGAATLSTAAVVTIAQIRSNLSGAETPAPAVFTGDQYLVTADNASLDVYRDADTSPIKIYPTLPGTEYCEGNTGALLCKVTIKLTGSGAHRNNNAGSFVCSTSTCSIVSAYVLAEAIPVTNDRLYGGWTTSPGTQSGNQLFNWGLAAGSGKTIVGSGAYIAPGGLNVAKDVPPGATIKFVWTKGNGSENYGSYKAAAVLTYWKFYNP